MVDWPAVERLRAKGWDWERIAADPSVRFSGADGGQAGDTLRARYYRRKGTPASTSPDGRLPDPPPRDNPRRWGLVRVGFLLAPAFGVWFLLSWLAPSPVGVYIGFSILGILFAVGAAVLCFGLWRATERWNAVFRRTATIGLIGGLVAAGALAGFAYAEGCRYLTPFTSGAPGGWEKAADPAWTVNGAAVVFFYGSAACPYCSASSWALEAALLKFGALSGTTFGHSSPSDVFANTPEVVLASAALSSPYVALDVRESTDENTISVPPTGACVEQGYLSAYDPVGSIPFLAVGGVYVHTETLVDPSALAGVTAPTLQGEVLNESGPQWSAIGPAAFLLMALLVKVDGGQPSSVAQIPAVALDLPQLG